MRTAVYETAVSSDAKSLSIIVPGIWSTYAPRTNIVWLLFLLKNLLKNRKPDVVSPSDLPDQQKQHKRKPLAPCSTNSLHAKHVDNGTKATGDHKQTGTDYGETLLQVSVFKKVLEERMVSVLELLDLEHGSEDMCCAADLVAYAIDEGWLDEEDFF